MISRTARKAGICRSDWLCDEVPRELSFSVLASRRGEVFFLDHEGYEYYLMPKALTVRIRISPLDSGNDSLFFLSASRWKKIDVATVS